MSSREDDAASGIFTHDGSFTSSAQNSCVTDGSMSFAAKVAAENKRVAQEFDLPLGVYGFGGPPSTNGATSTNGSMPTDDVASTFSGVFDMDDSSFVRGVTADAVFEAQERAEEQDRSRTPPGSKGEDTRGTGTVGEYIGGYDVPSVVSSSTPGSNGGGGGVFDVLVRTMVSMGLAWGTTNPRPATPETTDKTATPTGSQEGRPSGNASVSVLSYDGPGPEINSTASASKAPFFKGRTVARNYPARSTVNEEEKPPLLNPARLITICSCVVLISVSLAVGGWVAISRRGEDSVAALDTNDQDEFRAAIPKSTSSPVAAPVPPAEPPCGEDSLSASFDINGDSYDCIWFSQRSAAYRSVMCSKREDIATACRQTCSGNCAPSTSPVSTPEVENDLETATTVMPSVSPTHKPTSGPSAQPSSTPTTLPTSTPTAQPTSTPSSTPTAPPTSAPTALIIEPPTRSPTFAPFAAPTSAPSFVVAVPPPTRAPTRPPTVRPTSRQTEAPIAVPTRVPTMPPVPVPVSTDGPTETSVVCPPDQPGFIPGSNTSCEDFARFHPDFRAQRCQPGWPVFDFCYATCGNCFSL